MPDPALPRAYEFGPFRFDVTNWVLERQGVAVALPPKVIDMLGLLLERRDRVISKDELMNALWPDSFVVESNLTQTVYALRKALGGGYIQTVPRRGYRFLAQAKEISGDTKMQTLAVLPFRPLTTRGADEALELGIADALITSLGNAGLLLVRSISASQRYAGSSQDSLVAAHELAVDAVLEGTIQRSGDTLRVTARLLRADGKILWAGRFHEVLSNIFAVQDAIADKITSALEVRFGREEAALRSKRYTDNPNAYRQYLNGRYNWSKGTEEGLRKAIEFYHHAITLDPNYALAYVGIADAYTALDWYGALSTRQSNPQAFAAAETALRCDSELAEAHATMAVAWQYRWDWRAAETAFRRSIQLNPNYASARQWFAMHLSFRGLGVEALAEIATAEQLDPMSLVVRAQHALILYFARRFDDAITQCHQVLEVEPANDEARLYLALSLIEKGAPDAAAIELQRTTLVTTPDVRAMLARALACAGRPQDARQLLAEMTKRNPAYIPHFWIAAAYVSLQQPDAALRHLEAAFHDPDDSLAGIAVAPFFDPLRGEPRFRAVLTQMGLAGSNEQVLLKEQT